MQLGISASGGISATPATSVTYATLNPADSGGGTISNGDLTITGGGSGWSLTRATIGKDTDEWCCEVTLTNSGGNNIVGVCSASATLSSFVGGDVNGYGYYSANGNLMNNSGGSALGSPWSGNGTIVGIKFNSTARTLQFYLEGVAQGGSVDVSSLTGPIFVCVSAFSGGDVLTLNFGATPMTYDYSSANVGVFNT